MSRQSLIQTSIIGGSIIVAGALMSSAGPINPPPGPVGDTGPSLGYKTLQQIEPRIEVNPLIGDGAAQHVISQSGSYYLTGQVNNIGNKAAIRIDASDVTLDLNGFQVARGFFASTHSGIEVGTAPGIKNIRIRNGTVTGWTQDGINLQSVTLFQVVDVTLTSNGGAGIRGGTGGIIQRCLASANGTGIDGGLSTIVEECHAIQNIGTGIRTLQNGIVRDCTALNNPGDGISVGEGSAVTACTARGNDTGVMCEFACTVSGCSVVGNSYAGIHTFQQCTVTACAASGAGTSFGILTPGRSVIADCAARSSEAVNAGSGSNVHDCSVSGGIGIYATSGTTIRNCTYLDEGTGIHVYEGCYVTGNTCISPNDPIPNSVGISVDGVIGAGNSSFIGNVISHFGTAIDGNGWPGNIAIHNCLDANDTGIVDLLGIVGPGVDESNVLSNSNPHSNYDH